MALLLAAVAAVSLVVGGIGVMNIMLASVVERTREIGLRLAVGARARDVLSQFLAEALVLSIAGGLGGVVLGYGAAKALTAFLGWPTEMVATTAAIAVAFSAAVGIFFGWYPAARAAHVEPIEALRWE
jgi:putative ABC transport system permease protein